MANNVERARKSRLRARAQRRALLRLSHLHPQDWRRLYVEERARLADEYGSPRS
jgi:hypothetical protein